MRTTKRTGWLVAGVIGLAAVAGGANPAEPRATFTAQEIAGQLEKVAAAQQEALQQLAAAKNELAIVKVRVSMR